MNMHPQHIHTHTHTKKIIIHTLLLQVNYLIDEAFNVGKGANSIISMLHHFLHHHGFGESSLYLHADNCSDQKKPVHDAVFDVACTCRS